MLSDTCNYGIHLFSIPSKHSYALLKRLYQNPRVIKRVKNKLHVLLLNDVKKLLII